MIWSRHDIITSTSQQWVTTAQLLKNITQHDKHFHFTDRQTDRQTGRQAAKLFCTLQAVKTFQYSTSQPTMYTLFQFAQSMTDYFSNKYMHTQSHIHIRADIVKRVIPQMAILASHHSVISELTVKSCHLKSHKSRITESSFLVVANYDWRRCKSCTRSCNHVYES